MFRLKRCTEQVYIQEDEEHNIHFKNLSVHRAATEEEALNLVSHACCTDIVWPASGYLVAGSACLPLRMLQPLCKHCTCASARHVLVCIWWQLLCSSVQGARTRLSKQLKSSFVTGCVVALPR
jgi:hypothetical protein